jgi:predicted CopG family antitoxin
MARLTISIPDELHRSLERFRERLNISKVCQEALAKEIAKLEQLPRGALELEEMVERLRDEKAAADKHWFAQGVTDGISWTHGAAYPELLAAADPTSPLRKAGQAAVRAGIQRRRRSAGFDEASYVAGWRTAAAEVWARVKETV